MSKRALTTEYLDALVAAQVSACAMRCAIVIGRMQGNHENAWPTIETIREKVGGDRRTVQRALEELRGVGLLTTEERRGKGSLFSLVTHGVHAAGGESDTGGNDATGGGGNQPTGGAASTPPAGDTFCTSLLISDLKPIQRSQYTEGSFARGESRVLQGFDRRWREKRDSLGRPLGDVWPGVGPNRDMLDRWAAWADAKPDELDASLDGYFASDDPFVAKVRWNFATWGRDPMRYASARAEPHGVDLRALVSRVPSPTESGDESGPIVLELPKAARRTHA